MVIKGRGKKHTCQSCDALFYDLKSKPILCPKCGTEVKKRPPSKPRRSATRAPKPVEKKVEERVVVESDVEEIDVDVEEKDEDSLIEDMSDMSDDDDIPEVKDNMSSDIDDKD